MNYKNIVQNVFDELLAEAATQDSNDELVVAQDGNMSPADIYHMGWLQEHDDRYHGGHYEEGQRCNLREKLGVGDNADRLDDAGRNALQQLQNAPTRAEFFELMERLREGGQIDEDVAEDIRRMSRSAFNAINRADDEGFELTQEMRDNLIGMNEVYQALNAAYPQEQAQQEQAAQQERQNGEEANQNTDTHTNQSLDEFFNHFGELSATRSGRDEIRELIAEKIGKEYDWPFNSRHPVNVDLLTPDMLTGIAANLPSGLRRTFRKAEFGRGALNILKDPTFADSGYGQRELDMLIASSNKNAKRFIDVLNALHPGCIEAREARRQRATNENNARAFENIMTQIDSRGDGVTPNLTDDQYAEATNTLVGLLGEGNRDRITNGMSAFREGRSNDDQVEILSRYLPGNSPVVAEAMRIRDLRRTERERRQQEFQNNKPHLHPAVASEDVVSQDKALAESMGIRFKGAGVPLTQISGSRHFGSGYSNCWHNANAVCAQMRGLDIFPKMDGHDLLSFGSCKLAMSKAYERIDTGNDAQIYNWLNTHTFSDGDAISAWSGYHNHVFVYNKGNWYLYDGYYRNFGGDSAVSQYTIEGAMSKIHNETIDLDGSVGGYYNGAARTRNGKTAKEVILSMAKREMRIAANNMTLNPSTEELEEAAKDLLARSQGSYYIPINKPLIKEMLKSNDSGQ